MTLALAAVAALSLAGCGGGDDSTGQTAGTPSASRKAAEEKGSGGNDPAEVKARTQGKGGEENAGAPPASRAVPGQGSADQGGGRQGTSVQPPKGEPEPTATPAEQARATVADIALSSPAMQAGPLPTLPTPYTCGGGDSWPVLQWQGVPADSEELILFALNMQPVDGKLFFDWAVAGLDPSLQGLEAGRLPAGAIRGKNSFGTDGYSICPPEGRAETHVFALHAIPTALSPARGFDPGDLRRRVLAQAGNVGLLVFSASRG